MLEIIAGFALEGPLGGIERFGISLARKLDPARFNVAVCGLWDWGTPSDVFWRNQLNGEGITSFTAARKDEHAPYRNFQEVLQGIRVNTPWPVDIIHSHSEFGDVAAILLRRSLNAKAIVRTVHNEREWPKRLLRRLVLTNFVNPIAFDAELGVSQQVVVNLNRRPFARFLGKRAQLMYNALDFRRFARKSMVERITKRQSLDVPADAPLVGSVGRLTRQKGYHRFLQAAQIVSRIYPECHFLLVGDGELRQSLECLADELNIAAKFHFTGRRSDVEEILAAMDVFVSSSLWEGLPTVILESMAARVPVVATAVAGSTELVVNEKTGLLVAPNDPLALAEATCRLLSSPALCARFADAAEYHARTHFSIEIVAQAHAQLYTSLIGGE